MSKVVVVLTSNTNGPKLPFHDRFEDRISAHVEFLMNDGLREKIMSREIEKMIRKFRTAIDQLKVSTSKTTTTTTLQENKLKIIKNDIFIFG